MSELPTFKITRADLNDRNEYVGATDVSDYDGHIEIDADLGCVKFRASISAKGRIRALSGTGIEAGAGIEAGYGIEAGWGIEAGTGIEAGLSIASKWVSVRLRIFAGMCSWKFPPPDEMEVRAEIRSGTIAFGTHVPPANADDPKSAGE